jgi:AcrR family transcriptional regulator
MSTSKSPGKTAGEGARQRILTAAIEVISERGVHGATIADITGRAGVAQGLVSYHFGGKDQLIAVLVDRWFEIMFTFPIAGSGDADARLRALIDASLSAAGEHLALHRIVLAMQQDPQQVRFFVDASIRNAESGAEAEAAVRQIFAERGAQDPALEEIMLRTTLEGIVIKYAIEGDRYPMEQARRWVRRMYGLSAE